MTEPKTIYAWHISRKQGTLFEGTFYAMGMVVFFPVLVVIPFFVVAFWWPLTAFWLGVCALLISILVLLHSMGMVAGVFRSTQNEQLEGVGHTIASAGIIPAISFFLLSVNGSPLAFGFTKPNDPSLTQSFLIIADNFLKVILFDLTEIWNLRLTTILPESWYALAVTTLIRVAFGLGLVGVFFRFFKSRLNSDKFFGTREECYLYCDAKMNPENLTLCINGRVEALQEEQLIDWDELKTEVEKSLG